MNSEEEIRVIDVTGNPKERENVLTGAIFPKTKDENGLMVMKDFPFVYRDQKIQLAVYYCPYAPVDEAAEKLSDNFLKELTAQGGVFRITDTFNRLVEKILIREAGLDDRFIEIIKILAISQSAKKNPGIAKAVPLFSPKSDDEFQLDFYLAGTIQGTVPFNRELYRSVEKDFGAMADSTPVTGWVVDSGWVDRMLDQAHQ